MTAHGERGVVVVGVSGQGAGDAVEWAAAEAAARRSPLLVVHAFRWPPQVRPYGLVPVIAGSPAVPEVAERLLRAAVRRAQAVAPELDLSAQLLAGTPSRILLEQSRRAALLVLGGRPRGRLRRLFTGSIAGRVSARARCPVVVTRARREPSSQPTPPRVVVGVDDTLSSAAAVGFAFRAAAQRGIPLAVVHAWQGAGAAGCESSSCPLEAAEADAGRTLDRALRRWREQFTDVPVLTRLPHADPSPALIGESVGAALVVVGSHGRRAVLAGRRGSVSRTVLFRAHSAVAVVRPDDRAPTRAAGGRRRRSAAPRGDADGAVT